MINVLVIDDDAMVAELNRSYIGQLSGFSCCGIASNLQQARAYLHRDDCAVDLILLDVYLHHENGLDLLPELRESRSPVEVIVISSASDAATIRQSLHYGVVDYLIKPFQFSRFAEALNGWQQQKALLDGHHSYQQQQLDLIIHGDRTPRDSETKLPKGLTPQTLRTLCQWIDAHPGDEFSTDELAAAVAISRVSCRKYLIWLAQCEILYTSIHYGATGRPVYRYRLQAEQMALLKAYCR